MKKSSKNSSKKPNKTSCSRRFCITGSTGGLGLALCSLLVQKGYTVLAVGRNLSSLQKLQKELGVEICQGDLLKDTKKIAHAIKEFRADGIINNAGLGYYGPFHEANKDQIEETIHLKTTAILSLLHEVIPYWIEEKIPATILNIASAAALLPYPYFATYSSTNRFLLHFSLALHEELKPHHISSLCFCPGSIQTPFAEKASNGFYKKQPPMILSSEKTAEAILKQIEKKRPFVVYDRRYLWLIRCIKCLPRFLQGKLLMKSLAERINSSHSQAF